MRKPWLIPRMSGERNQREAGRQIQLPTRDLLFLMSFPCLLHGPAAVWLRSSLALPTAADRSASLSVLQTWGKHGAETQAVETARQPAADRRAAKPGAVEPVAATKHAEGARWRTLWIGHTPSGIVAIPVLAPLPNIPVHVIQSPPIGLLLPHRNSFFSKDNHIQGILNK